MKAIVVMFDSLNRHMLPPYGGDWTHAPNFSRLAEQSVTFDNNWAGSMPCMPARRDMLTGRYNFLHRSWGPLEPFDDSMPALLRAHKVYSHLVSDHYHYWEPGGATYHSQYTTWDFVRGQEGDPWKGEVADPEIPQHVGNFVGYRSHLFRQDWINRKYMQEEQLHPQTETFARGIEFIRTNRNEDRWLLQIEAFDPHEPFFAPQKYKDMYPHDYTGEHFDWPGYQPVQETREEVEHCKYEYAALLSMCDTYLGKVMDTMDEYDLWQDTMLIVTTDHGFLFGEHDWWAKNIMPFYNEIARTPLFVWDPRDKRKNERCDGLTQLIDLAPTLLEFFGVDVPKDVLGVPLRLAFQGSGAPQREAVLFGIHGGHVNCTDGRYVYMRAPVRPDNTPLFNYTLMPTHMTSLFSVQELQEMELADPFSFTKGVRTLKIPATSYIPAHRFGTLLYDLATDPEQKQPIQDAAVEKRMIDHLIRIMNLHHAPPEQFERLGI
ncbi:sulfatase-like hydrolase/transferase [Paenibacillus aceris]|uniref:Arylsulfatase A-like enzyme n=1 Tax=Paenibacillus aceris TaxID=869555 RepID=A0ABS4I4A3_9BACL|nr:sulfatase-like hydrolase/transferase [Paenibacillus aceris]MBP1964974.1 arylsulfatase A-like enzyme [Paenibacillus aceris]NHW35635.1 sulfatase-like hydrolase/transferase [Paenibacillus aceris]